MNTKSDDKLVNNYLKRLEAALATLPSSERTRIVEEISTHISLVRSQANEGNESEIRNLLERLGTPETIASEAGAQDPSPWNRRVDGFVPYLLLFGGFLYMIGWAVGVAKLWTSRSWSWWEKVLGTLVLPGGLVPFWLVLANHVALCTGQCGIDTLPTIGILELLGAFAAPILMVAYLDIKRRRILKLFSME